MSNVDTWNEIGRILFIEERPELGGPVFLSHQNLVNTILSLPDSKNWNRKTLTSLISVIIRQPEDRFYRNTKKEQKTDIIAAINKRLKNFPELKGQVIEEFNEAVEHLETRNVAYRFRQRLPSDQQKYIQVRKKPNPLLDSFEKTAIEILKNAGFGEAHINYLRSIEGRQKIQQVIKDDPEFFQGKTRQSIRDMGFTDKHIRNLRDRPEVKLAFGFFLVAKL